LGPGKIELILEILRARTLQTKLNLLDQVRDVIRRGHFSIRTEEAYPNWARKASPTRRSRLCSKKPGIGANSSLD
jgi:hypothetical protein